MIFGPAVHDPDGDPTSEVLEAAATVLQAVLVIDGSCPGTLVVHFDGTAAACSEELDGRDCPGPDQPHLERVSCRDLLGLGGCDECQSPLPEDWDDDAWRHALRDGARLGRQHCRRHRSDRVA